MTPLAKITMTFVVFIDIIGQGLVFPIINALIMESSSTFLPTDTAQSARHFYYGLVIGSFFLAWFLGPLPFLAATTLTLFMLLRREFASETREALRFRNF